MRAAAGSDPIISPDGFWQWDGTRWTLVGQPRAAPAGLAAEPYAPPPRYASPRLSADIAVMFLLIMVAASALDIVNSALDLAAIRGALGPGIAGTHLLWSDNRNLLAAAAWLLLGFPGSVIAFSVWVHHAYRNLAALGRRSAFSPAMAVGWLYVPVANLWMSLVVVRDLYVRMAARPVPWLPVAWWASFWLGSVAGIVQMQASLRETDLASRVGPILLSFPSDVLYIVAALLLVRIVLVVTAAEEEAGKKETPPWG